VETSADVPADAVYFTWRLPPRSTTAFDAIDLLFTVLGAGQTSRLHKSLVRSRELAEGSGASTMGLIGGNSFGFAYARARDGVSLDELEEALVGEIDRLVGDGPTELELRRAKAQYERHWLHELARVDSRADAFGEFATLERDPHRVNTRLAEVESVQPADVADAARQWFSTDQRATLIYRQEQS
jgi:predicted Zn-dependent peptidase